MKQHEKLRLIAKGFATEKVTTSQARSAAEAIADAADRLEVLEREHQEFFERWHDERRKRERLELAMTEIAAHHDDQRQCWLDDDSDQARYHEERRNLALMQLPSNAPHEGPSAARREGPLDAVVGGRGS